MITDQRTQTKSRVGPLRTPKSSQKSVPGFELTLARVALFEGDSGALAHGSTPVGRIAQAQDGRSQFFTVSNRHRDAASMAAKQSADFAVVVAYKQRRPSRCENPIDLAGNDEAFDGGPQRDP